MKKLIWGALAALAATAPGLANADTGGSIKLTYASLDDEADSTKDGLAALSGVVITDLGQPGWRVQFNGASADLDLSGTSYAYSQVEGHVTYDAGQFEIGGFGGLINTNGYGLFEYGVEAAMNFSRGRIAVSAAGADGTYSSFEAVTSLAAMGTLNVTDNFSVGANVSTSDYGDYGSGDSVDSYGVDVSYLIPNSSFAIGAGYRVADYGSEVDFMGVSLAWGFGEGARGRQMLGAAALLPDAIAEQ